MDPSRKRTIRFVVALSAAVLLAGALAYTSFSASTEARQPSELAAAQPTPGKKYQLVGKVVPGYTQKGDTTYFSVRDRNGKASVPVTYSGSLPDPFRADREIVVDVVKQGNVYVGQKGSLVTKCPSKFTADKTNT
ncbi:MAG TPA: cytochrome c maturation protein CcmE [Solirubrobacter sp.]|nr:cytochrome c maturation protein CcmE [Solirubrobacter sp.]